MVAAIRAWRTGECDAKRPTARIASWRGRARRCGLARAAGAATARRSLCGRHAHWQPRRRHAAGARRAGPGRRDLLRGHPPQPHFARPLCHGAPDAFLSRAQCRPRAAARLGRAGRRKIGGPHQRRGHTAHLRSRIQAGARSGSGGLSGDGNTRGLGCRGGAGLGGACHRRFPVCGFPAAAAPSLELALAGALFAAGFEAWPLVICGILKTVYDIALLCALRHIKPPEEQ